MKRFIQLLLCTLLVLTSAAHAKTPDQLRNEFINDMVKRYGFSRDELTKTLNQAVTQKKILEAISRPAERTLNWTQYRAIFLKPDRIHGGVDFWRQHANTLARAEKEYGVPPQIIVAILGVETRYGAHTGGHRVIDALHTLGFHYPRRGEFFREQLSHFLRFAKEEEIAPTMPTGSYAGAMGMPQFMPDSFRVYAIDFDGDGHRDIWDNPVDVIGSVANYFVKKGNWKRGRPVATPASGVTAKHQAFVDAGAKPRLSATQLSGAGIKFDDAIAKGGKVSLMDFDTDNGTEYWVGSNNFYSIMRYNPRTKYAMAVYQLSEAILDEYQKSQNPQPTAGKQP